jgi:hypothetical protein
MDKWGNSVLADMKTGQVSKLRISGYALGLFKTEKEVLTAGSVSAIDELSSVTASSVSAIDELGSEGIASCLWLASLMLDESTPFK